MTLLPRDYTPQEDIIADCLSIFGLRYDQQVNFCQYTADFYIPEIRMIIEADGKYGHLKKRDNKRDLDLREHDEVDYILHVKDTTKENIKETLWQGLSKLEPKPE